MPVAEVLVTGPRGINTFSFSPNPTAECEAEYISDPTDSVGLSRTGKLEPGSLTTKQGTKELTQGQGRQLPSVSFIATKKTPREK